MSNTDRATTMRNALEACVVGDFDSLGDCFTDDVTAWSPAILVESREELAEALAGREAAFSELEVHIDALDVFGDKGVAEFRVTARFTEPFSVGEEEIEPNGQLITIGSALVVDFEGDRISAFRNYFDEGTLLEQMLLPA